MELTPEAWHLFAIFIPVFLVLSYKGNTYGFYCCDGCGGYGFTRVCAFKCWNSITLALGSFGNKVIWLIRFPFFYRALGFIKTGLGNRIAFWYKIFGKVL